jgi:hypothetical protein
MLMATEADCFLKMNTQCVSKVDIDNSFELLYLICFLRAKSALLALDIDTESS